MPGTAAELTRIVCRALAIAILVAAAVTAAVTLSRAAEPLVAGWRAVVYVKVGGSVQTSRHGLVHLSKEACEAWLETPKAKQSYLEFVMYAAQVAPNVELSDPVCEQDGKDT